MIVTDVGDVCQEKIGAKSHLDFNISEDRISRANRGVFAHSQKCSHESLAFSVANSIMPRECEAGRVFIAAFEAGK